MSNEYRAEPAQFKLYPRQKQKLNRIAAFLSEERGELVTQAAAIRHLIDAFSLPEGSPERTGSPERIAA